MQVSKKELRERARCETNTVTWLATRAGTNLTCTGSVPSSPQRYFVSVPHKTWPIISHLDHTLSQERICLIGVFVPVDKVLQLSPAQFLSSLCQSDSRGCTLKSNDKGKHDTILDLSSFFCMWLRVIADCLEINNNNKKKKVLFTDGLCHIMWFSIGHCNINS